MYMPSGKYYVLTDMVKYCKLMSVFQVDKEKYDKLCAMTSMHSSRGRSHRGRGFPALTAAAASLRGEKKASNQSSPMTVSHSEDVSSEGSDSDSSYVDSNDSEDDDGSNGSNSKTSISSAPPVRPRTPSTRNTVS